MSEETVDPTKLLRALVAALCFPVRLPMQPAGTEYEKKRAAAAAEAVKDADAILKALG